MNEKENNETLMKVRSARACIADGYRLYTGNFRRIFRRSWTAAVVYALVYALMSVISLDISPRLTALAVAVEANPGAGSEAAMAQYLMLMGRQGLVLLLFALAATLFASYGFAALDEHRITGVISPTRKWVTFYKRSAWRTLKALLFVFLLSLLLVALMAGESAVASRLLSPTASLVLLVVLSLVVLVFSLPMEYIAVRYMFNRDIGFWRDLTSGYTIGFRHWGLIFVVQLVTVLAVALATLFASMPATVLTLANLQARIGVLNGDPLGMPDYMGWLTAAVFVVAGFFQAYIHLSMLFPTYYMYGSIEQQEEEKKQMKL